MLNMGFPHIHFRTFMTSETAYNSHYANFHIPNFRSYRYLAPRLWSKLSSDKRNIISSLKLQKVLERKISPILLAVILESSDLM